MIGILKRFTPIFLAVSLVAACATDQYGQKQTAGAIIGGIGGAVAGSQFGKGDGRVAATAVGTLLGAWIGSEVGASLDRADRMAMQRAQTVAYEAPIGETIRWNNPESGHSGTYTPTREGRHTETGAYCREFQTTVNIGNRTEEAYGRACRQPDGSWQIVQ